MPMGESDRLLTILTPELGLIRAVAPGSRKPKSKLGGRSGLFVVNELLIYKGRSLDRITQAETVESYPGLSKNLARLAAGQYLAELALCQALSGQTQSELFYLLGEHLGRIERSPNLKNSPSFVWVLPLLIHGIYHMLALGGIAPQVHRCCLTQRKVQPDFDRANWQVGFSILSGGTVCYEWMIQNFPQGMSRLNSNIKAQSVPAINNTLNAVELAMLQQLTSPELPPIEVILTQLPTTLTDLSLNQVWMAIEKLLRQYAQVHLDRSLRSATLLDTHFQSIC